MPAKTANAALSTGPVARGTGKFPPVSGSSGPACGRRRWWLRTPKLMRGKFRDFLRKTVEARQALVLFLDVTAIHHPVGGGSLRFRLGRNRRIVAIQPVLGRIVNFETRQQLLCEGFRRSLGRLRLTVRGRPCRRGRRRRVVLLRQSGRCAKYDDQRKQLLHVLSPLASNRFWPDSSAHFPKFVLHRSTHLHELRKVMGNSQTY